jgi:polyhydroxyalkanoate synthesis regulator phasin
MSGCNSYIVPTFETDPCHGDKKSTKCVIDENAFIELNLPANSTQEAVNGAMYQALQAQALINDAQQEQIDDIINTNCCEDVEAIQANVETLNTTVADLQSQVDELPTNDCCDDIVTIQSDITDLQENIDVIEEDIIDLQEQIDNIPSGAQGPIGPQGIPGPVGPAGLEWQGVWDADTSYAADDAVSFNGASWFCINPVTTTGNSNPSVDTTNWALLASQGATGPQGPQGIQGVAGPSGTSEAKTVGEVIFGFGTINTLSYDINKIPTNGNSDGGLAYLPNTTGASIGKEVTVACFSNGTFNIRTFDNSLKIINNNINPGSELSASIVKISNGEILKFTLIDNGFWILDYVTTSKENRTLYSLTGGPTALAPRVINGTRVNATTTGFYALPSSSSTVASNINEVTIYTQNATATIQAATGGNISFTNNNSYTAAYTIPKYSTVRFTRYFGENWLAEVIVGSFPTFNGNPLNAGAGFDIVETEVNNTSTALSLADLNTAYPSTGINVTPNGFKVYCTNIGLVYIKVNYETWVSQEITNIV